MKLEDIITLAKAGYTPKQVKELLEWVETSPKVKETKVEDVQQKQEETVVESKEEDNNDPLAVFNKLLD